MAAVDLVAIAAVAGMLGSVPIPTANQIEWQRTPFRTFHHFGICTYEGCEHNTGSEKHGESGPPSAFNPSNATPEQWVLSAKALGVGGAVLTARHEGGFCLFPSKYTNYSIANSPLRGRDLVREFVDACRKHGLKPSLYFAASCDGYHKNYDRLSPQDYLQAQLNMLTEVVTNYGDLEYIWFDHHGNPVGGGDICDPLLNTFWEQVDKTMRSVAPNVLIGGMDLNVGPMKGVIQNHFSTCNTTDGSVHSRCTPSEDSSAGPFGEFYRPMEITNSAFDRGWFWHPGGGYWSTAKIWNYYWTQTAAGYNSILNFPPNQEGVLDESAVTIMEYVGQNLTRYYGSEIGRTTHSCGAGQTIELSIGASTPRSVMLLEDLTSGQRISNYTVTVGGGIVASASTIGQRRVHNIDSSPGPTTLSVQCSLVTGGSTNVTVVALAENF